MITRFDIRVARSGFVETIRLKLASNLWRFPDEQEHVSGKAEEIKGKVKEKVGHATDDPNTEAAGLKDQAKGKVKQAEGDVKEALHKPHKA